MNHNISFREVFPREIDKGVFWLNNCIGTSKETHGHLSIYLLVGSDKTMLIDTSMPSMWTEIERQIDDVLGGGTLDYLLVTHPEFPHSGNIGSLVKKFPDVRIIADARDYHVFYPQHAPRVLDGKLGDIIDLGGLRVELIEAVIKDLPNTLWAYEHSQQIMFVSDGFGFVHHSTEPVDGLLAITYESEDPEPRHTPGECALLTSEIGANLTLEQVAFIMERALHWTRFVESRKVYDKVAALLHQYPPRLIAPAHGNVIDNIADVFGAVVASHEEVFQRTTRAAAAMPGN